MAKNRRPKKKSTHTPRTDADRRLRQSERLARHLRVLHCIMGRGRWDVESLAAELECSPRTVHRILQTLSMAGVPWYFCKESQCYRVREGFRFPGLQRDEERNEGTINAETVLPAAQQLLEDGERFMDSLRQFCETLEGTVSDADQPD